MSSVAGINDAILQSFLMAQDSGESQRQLMILFAEHVEARIRSIILAHLRTHPGNHQNNPDFDDLYGETRARLVRYLNDLKEDVTAGPCKDFKSYAATIAHNVCHDYFRQMYPARARLRKKLRDLLDAHPDFALWQTKDQTRTEWVCGFESWRGQQVSAVTNDWLQHFYEDPITMTEALSSGRDIRCIKSDDLLTSLFNEVGEPIAFADVINIVSDIMGVKDFPAASLDADGSYLSVRLPDSTLRIDSVLEMREPLMLFWQGLRELPEDQFKAYLLYARDSSGEDLINLLLAAEIATESEIAIRLAMTPEEFEELRLDKLPLDNEDISKQLGVTVERVYKLRYRAGKHLKSLLAELIPQKKNTM